MTAAPKRPILRYHGGKFGSNGTIANWIVSHLPRHTFYVEPFCGAASVFMRKPRSGAAEVLNDLDVLITTLFRVVREPYQARELERRLRLTPYSRTEFEIAQDWLRAGADRSTLDPVEVCRMVLVASFMGHGSAGLRGSYSTGFRSSETRGRFMAANDWMRYPNHIHSFTDRLKGVTIECRPWQMVADRYDGEDTLFYIDPPYLRDTRTAHPSDGYKHDMDSEEGHTELAEWCRAARGMIVLSHYDHALYQTQYSSYGWACIKKDVHVDSGAKRTECLWLNPAAQSAQRQHDLFSS